MGMGGIAAHFPSKVESHYVSPHLPPGHDTFGEVLKEAHAHKIRVIGRFDFSKVAKPIYDAHPDWFFRKANGEPATYNGLYATCINGAYYREQTLKILGEALERYDVDGLFFNAPGQPASDYSGNRYGMCTCDSCKTRFQAMYHRPLPSAPDADYNRFIAAAAQEITKNFAELIHSKRPKAGFFTYTEDYVDGTTSESNTAIGRGLPLWPYSASESVGRARDNQPSKMPINLSIGFVDIPYRFSSVPPAEIQIRLYQNMAHGSGPAFVVVGTLDQEDRTGILAARPAFKFNADHEDLYVGQESAARVLLLSGGRGGGGRRARRRAGWLSRVLSNTDRAAYSLRSVGESGPAQIAQIRPRNRPGRRACGTRRLRSAGRPVADRGGARTGHIHGPNRKAVDRHALGLLPHSRPRDVSFAKGHRPGVPGWRIPRTGAFRKTAFDPDSSIDVRPAREGAHRQGRNRETGLAAGGSRQRQDRVYPLGHRRTVLPAQLTEPRRPGGGPDRSPAAQRAPAEIECASAGRNDADESTQTQPHASCIW